MLRLVHELYELRKLKESDDVMDRIKTITKQIDSILPPNYNYYARIKLSSQMSPDKKGSNWVS